MIEAQMSGICTDCPHMSLVTNTCYYDGRKAEYDFSCEHEDICRRAISETIEAVEWFYLKNFKDFDPQDLHFSINDIRNNFAGMAKDIWDGGDDE